MIEFELASCTFGEVVAYMVILKKMIKTWW